VEGDLRFLSHHDGIRVIERLASRAALPVHYSQGFNPRPLMSLVLPRPVGVASRQDLLVLTLEEPFEGPDLVDRLNSHAPKGMHFFDARPIGAKAPQPIEAAYELPIQADTLRPVSMHINELQGRPSWPVQRHTPRQGAQLTSRTIDLLPMVADLCLADGLLRIILRRHGDAWARPAEVLALIGLDPRVDLARLVRTEVKCEAPSI
jgi:radical SAM-linked protein